MGSLKSAERIPEFAFSKGLTRNRASLRSGGLQAISLLQDWHDYTNIDQPIADIQATGDGTLNWSFAEVARCDPGARSRR